MRLLRQLPAWSLALACAIASAQAVPQPDGPRALLLAGRFADLEQLYVKESASTARRGTEMPSVFYFHRMQLGLHAQAWEQDDQATRRWLHAFPRSVPAAIARSYALTRRTRTLESRGEWGKIDALLKEQRVLLAGVRKQAAKDVTWHTLHVSLGRHAGWPLARIKAAIEDAMRADATSMYFYDAAAYALMPDSRQSPESLAWLARTAAAHTRATHGLAMYASIYLWTVDRSVEIRRQPFTTGLIDWPLMDQGLADLHERQPGPGILNHHAALACLAGDKARTAAMLGKMGTQSMEPIWKDWGGAPLLERCKRFAQVGSRTS
jgi:hypothetical protein